MAATHRGPEEASRSTGRADWSTWLAYDAAASGLEGYWYPVLWANSDALDAAPLPASLSVGVIASDAPAATAKAIGCHIRVGNGVRP